MAKSYTNPHALGVPETFKCTVDSYILTQAALAFLSRNARITHRLRTKIHGFFSSLDPRQYDDNHDLSARLALVNKVATAVLKGGATSLTAVEHRLMENTDWADEHASFIEIYRSGQGFYVDGDHFGNELSDEQVQFLDEWVSTRQRYAHLWLYSSLFREISDRIDSGDVGEISVFNDAVMQHMEQLVVRGRNAKAVLSQEGQDFNTGDESFGAAIRMAHEARNRPQSVVRTGLHYMNEMLGGGYEGSRVYVHFGRSGDWKSGMLCSAAFWALDPRFNPSFQTRDPTRRPCVLFVTQENDFIETIERMMSFKLGSHVDLRGSDVDAIVRRMEEEFSSETCDFVFKYRASGSITTADLESMVGDQHIAGKEVVLVVHDYIKRIKPVQQAKDQRHLELGYVVDEFSVLAKRYNIPVVTGMQLNREAYTKFEAALKSGKLDAVKELGASNVGESINVYENADVVIFQGRVTLESTGSLYLTLRRGKFRGKRKSGLDFFAHPFDRDEEGEINEMRLVEDAHLPEKHARSLKELGDGLSREYDANAEPDENGGRHRPQTSRTERRGAQSAALLGGGQRGSSRPGPVQSGGRPSGGAYPPPERRQPDPWEGADSLEQL